MTKEEFEKVAFHETCHMALDREYITTYKSDDGELAFCSYVPRDKYGNVGSGKGYTHYYIKKKVYKTKEKFLEALKDYKPQI